MKFEVRSYSHCVGEFNYYIQITPKYRYRTMRKDKVKVYCRVAIEEACSRHKII